MKRKLNGILLIDDDESTNYFNELIINEADIALSVVSVQSAKQGLEILTHAKETSGFYPELIFLDINMPAMNGWEFLDQYKRMSPLIPSNNVIVMLTSSVNQDDELRASTIDEIADYKNKPLSEIVLDELVHKHFPELV